GGSAAPHDQYCDCDCVGGWCGHYGGACAVHLTPGLPFCPCFGGGILVFGGGPSWPDHRNTSRGLIWGCRPPVLGIRLPPGLGWWSITTAAIRTWRTKTIPSASPIGSGAAASTPA